MFRLLVFDVLSFQRFIHSDVLAFDHLAFDVLSFDDLSLNHLRNEGCTITHLPWFFWTVTVAPVTDFPSLINLLLAKSSRPYRTWLTIRLWQPQIFMPTVTKIIRCFFLIIWNQKCKGLIKRWKVDLKIMSKSFFLFKVYVKLCSARFLKRSSFVLYKN